MRSSSGHDLNSPPSSLLNRMIAVGSAGNLTVITGGYKTFESVSIMSAYLLFKYRMNKSGTAELFSPSLFGICLLVFAIKETEFFILQDILEFPVICCF